MDTDPRAVDAVNSGSLHITEPDLDEVVHRVVKSGLLSASLEVVPADVYVVAVPTPFMGDHQPDLRHVEAATRSIAQRAARAAALPAAPVDTSLPIAGEAERIVAPLARAALENTLQRGQGALTGPVARGDAAAVAGHLAALAEVEPDLVQAYRAAALRTAQRAHAPEEVFEVLNP